MEEEKNNVENSAEPICDQAADLQSSGDQAADAQSSAVVPPQPDKPPFSFFDGPPTANPVPLEAYLRPDVAETPLTQEEALAGGPKTEAGMFVAPRILGSEE